VKVTAKNRHLLIDMWRRGGRIKRTISGVRLSDINYIYEIGGREEKNERINQYFWMFLVDNGLGREIEYSRYEKVVTLTSKGHKAASLLERQFFDTPLSQATVEITVL
jgi:hypothetical protein